MSTGWAWDGFHPKKDELDGFQDPWLSDELVHGVQVKSEWG